MALNYDAQYDVVDDDYGTKTVVAYCDDDYNAGLCLLQAMMDYDIYPQCDEDADPDEIEGWVYDLKKMGLCEQDDGAYYFYEI